MSGTTRTEKNLQAALSGESKTCIRYLQVAKKARRDNMPELAAVFETAAENEKQHANLWMNELKIIGTAAENLRMAIQGEHDESATIYPAFAEIAREEGLTSTAWLFEKVAEIERRHEENFRLLLAALEAKKIAPELEFHGCPHCGFTAKTPAPECPICHEKVAR